MGAFRQRCQHLQWPADGPLKPCNILLAEESAFFDGQAFNEGPLLRILFDRLLALFEQVSKFSSREELFWVKSMSLVLYFWPLVQGHVVSTRFGPLLRLAIHS